MKKIKKFIKATWELPQNVLGAIVKILFKATPYTTYKDATVYSWDMAGGMSLGKYIFIPVTKTNYVKALSAYVSKTYVTQLIKHEYGHTIKSKYLGWFYLLVIGAPSLIWANCFIEYRQKTGKSYYDFYTEKWADKLGGVTRK